MPIKGEIYRNPEQTDRFELPDPASGNMTSGKLQIEPGKWRHIFWAPSHMINTGGAGRVYLKRDRVGTALSSANVPNVGSTDTLTDPETGVVVTVTRTK